MKTKILGRTGLNVSLVGLGTAYLGIPVQDQVLREYRGSASYMNEDLGVQTVHAAIEAGCSLIDTAALYGGTKAERIIGRALRERPDLAARCTISTKAGILKETGQDYSFEGVLRSVVGSQERLGIEEFQIVYIHDQMGVPMEEVMGKRGALGALRKLQQQGLIRFVGTAANHPETNAAYIETGEFDAAVVADGWSLLNQFAAERILPAAARYHVGIVMATPFEKGLLATGPVPGVKYHNRNFSPDCLEFVRRIQLLCATHQVSLAAAALQWCTRRPEIAAVIPGARTPQQAVENAQAGESDIPEMFWEDLAPIIRHFKEGVDR